MEGTGGEGSKSKDLKESPAPAAAAAGAPETKKGPWTAEEDAILIEHVRRNGEGNWNSVQRTSGLMRCGKSCRLRWANHLRPNLKKGQLTPEEELLVLRLHAQLGNKWARMAAQLPGRTDNEIKNYWNTRVKRRQRAGLPLYPPGILQRHRPPPLLIPSSGAAAAAVPPLSSSPPVFSSPMMMMPSAMAFSPSSSALRQLAEAPRAAKRARDDDGMTTMFRFPVSPLPSVVPRMWHTAPSTPTGTTMLDYSIMPPMTPPVPPSAYSAGIEMLARSSSCHVLDGSGGVELMDKLLQEAERAEQKEERDRAFDWADPFGSFDEGKESGGGGGGGGEAFMGLEELHCSSNGEPAPPPTNYSESNQLPTTNATGISVSGLLEMIPTQPAAPADWNNNNNNSEGSDVSNGGQSAVTNDDLAVDLHQLASSLPDAQMEPDWTMSSCHWNNLPELM